jgi:hypothetical protein
VAEDGKADFRAGLGSVEQEAHKLVRAAAEWLGSEEQHAAGAAAPEAGGQPPDEARSAGDEEPPGRSREQAPGEPHEQVTCTGCPWCRARVAAGPVGADTLDSLADLLASASVSLRHFAESRRAAQPGSGSGTGSRDTDTATATDTATDTDTDDFDYPDPT